MAGDTRHRSAGTTAASAPAARRPAPRVARRRPAETARGPDRQRLGQGPKAHARHARDGEAPVGSARCCRDRPVKTGWEGPHGPMLASTPMHDHPHARRMRARRSCDQPRLSRTKSLDSRNRSRGAACSHIRAARHPRIGEKNRKNGAALAVEDIDDPDSRIQRSAQARRPAMSQSRARPAGQPAPAPSGELIQRPTPHWLVKLPGVRVCRHRADPTRGLSWNVAPRGGSHRRGTADPHRKLPLDATQLIASRGHDWLAS
jgi:hypothetical protein